MNPQHLSDEAVAAAADGVLSGHARDRATKHLAVCVECSEAVRVQREAAWALRTAPPPSLPSELLDRLRTVAPDLERPLPSAWPDQQGGTYLPIAAPAAAIVPPTKHDDDPEAPQGGRRRPLFPTGLFRSSGH